MVPLVTPNFDFFYPEPGMRLNEEQYELLRHLGSGQYSTTWLAYDFKAAARGERLTYCVVKILTRTATEEHFCGRMLELTLHKAIQHDRSVEGVVKLQDDFGIQGQNGSHLCFVFIPLGSDVTALRMDAPNKALKPYIVKKIIYDIMGALAGLHEHKIIHTDVKGSNILFQGLTSNEIVGRDLANHPPEIVGQFEQGGRKHFVYAARPLPSPGTWDMSHYYSEAQEYCLVDLGHGQWAGQQPTVDVFGPLALRAPEIVVGSNFGPRLDVWAVGCLTFELLVGEWLFDPVGNGENWTVEEDLLAQIFAVTGDRFSPQTLSQARFKDGLLDGEGNLLRKKELPPTSIEARLASYNILAEDEIKPAAEFIGRCLQLEYSSRPTSEELSYDHWLAGWVCSSC